MEIVWSGSIEAINHRVQAFPHGQHSLAATCTQFITKAKMFLLHHILWEYRISTFATGEVNKGNELYLRSTFKELL